MTASHTGPACPACGRPVDPLRAGSVAILGGAFRYFCDQSCKAAFLADQGGFSERTEAPPAVALRERTPVPPAAAAVTVRERTPAPPAVAAVTVHERTPAPPAPVVLADASAEERFPEASSFADEEIAEPFEAAHVAAKEPPIPIALFGIAVALVVVILALLGPKMMTVRLPLVVLAALTALGYLGLSASVRSRPLALLIAQVLPLGVVPILAALAEFGKKVEHPGILATADSMTTLGAFVSLSILATELCARTVEGRLTREIAHLENKLPRTARLVENGIERTVPVEDVTPSAILRVRAGERVPLDATISWNSEAERVIVRATSVPVEVSQKDEVLAGFLLESGTLDLRVGAQPRRPWLSRIADRARGARDTRGDTAPVHALGLAMSRSGESALGRFLPPGLCVAALAYAAAGFAIGARGVELLAAAVAGFATVSVTAVLVSVRLSTRHGFLRAWEAGVTFQDAAAISRLGAVDTALLSGSDGSLCDAPLVVAVEAPPKAGRANVSEAPPKAGRANVSEAPPKAGRANVSEAPRSAGRANVSEAPRSAKKSDVPPSKVEARSPFRGGDHVLALAGSALAYVGDEPTATAIRAIFRERKLPTQPLRSCEVLSGLGVVGVLATGQRLVVGTHTLFLQEHISVAGAEGGALPSGRKNVYVALDGRLQGTVVLDALPRVVAAIAMQRLQHLRVEPVLLSLESREVAESVATAVCIEHVRPCASEDDALREVDALVEVGRITAVIGFPERDEALFERGHVGVAMRAACHGFREWSVATMSSDPRTLTAAFDAAVRLRDAHRRAVALSLGPGALALFAALFGLVPIYLPALLGAVGGVVALYRASVK